MRRPLVLLLVLAAAAALPAAPVGASDGRLRSAYARWYRSALPPARLIERWQILPNDAAGLRRLTRAFARLTALSEQAQRTIGAIRPSSPSGSLARMEILGLLRDLVRGDGLVVSGMAADSPGRIHAGVVLYARALALTDLPARLLHLDP